LVSSWQVSDSGRSWLLTLREDAHFHDGSPCTVEDIVTSFEQLAHADGAFGMGGVYKPYLDDLRLEPRSKSDLVVRTRSATGDLVDILAGIYVGKHINGTRFPLGTGPYVLHDYVEGEFAELSWVRRELPDPPYSEVGFLEIPEPEARYRALLAAEVDVARSLESMEEIPTQDELCWRRSTNTLSVTCFLNGFAEPFSESSARLGLNLAVDVESIIHNVWHGLAREATTVVSPYHFGYPSDLEPLSYDPGRAQELLEDCDVPDKLLLRTPLVSPDRALRVSRLVQQQLSWIGLSVEVEVESDRPKYARDVSEKRIGDMAVFDSSPLSTYRVLQEKISSEKQGLWWQGVAEEEADRLIEAARRTVSREQRRASYERCLRWLHHNPPWLYLYHPTRLYAHRREKPGVFVDHAGLLRVPGAT
jgi:peptide/nickel transport system substrate-binding protein